MADAPKLNHETYKQMTTLSSGSLVLLATFLSKAFPNPSGLFFAYLAFASFFLSILVSVLCMFGIAYSVAISELTEADRKSLQKTMLNTKRFDNYTSLGSCALFIIGMFSVAVFGVTNIRA